MTKLVFLVFLIFLLGCAQQNFKGVPVSPAKQAPDFTLINQFGEEVSLRDFRGKVVVVSFLYTSCPTVCPVIAHKFMKAAEELGDQARDDIVFIAVTVDPERDTQERVKEYSLKNGMLDKWQYLTAEKRDVEQVWKAYNIYVKKNIDEEGNYLVDHTTTVIIIDKKGSLRLLFPGITWDPKDLVHDVRLIMKEE